MLKISFRNILVILLLLSMGVAGKAQAGKRPFIIESRVHAGMSLPFYKALAYLNQDDIYAIDVSVGFPAFGKDYWEKLYHFPLTGFGFSVWTLGNNDILGRANALYYYLNFPLFKRSENFSLNYQISYGAAYLTKKFDTYDDPLNRAIGSHLNIYLRLGIDARIRILPKSDLVIEAGALHFSNGKTSSPNYGINAGSFSLGMNYLFGNSNISFPDPEVPELLKRNIQSIIASAGSKVYDNLLGNKYFTSSLTYNFEHLLNQRRRIGLGADLFYDESIREALNVEEGKTDAPVSYLFRFGLHASYTIRYKQLMMGIQAGHYIYSKFTVLTPVYTRLSVQYLFPRNIIGTVAIKSHFGKADCMEWGLGYCW